MVKTEQFMFLPFLPGGAPFVLGVPFSFYHIRGKNGKYRFAFSVFTGGYGPFSFTISAVKTAKIDSFLPFLPGGASFFNTISAINTVKSFFFIFVLF